MKVLLQRVSRASVTVDGDVVGKIGAGLLLFVGFGQGDTEAQLQPIVDKILKLRIFPDLNDCQNGRMNSSVLDHGLEVLAVSQFTLYADCKKGNRPSFNQSLEPKEASRLYDTFCELLELANPGKVARGIFAADMKVELVNDGPVTIMLRS